MCTTALYMFWMVFLSIVRSLRLYIQHQVYRTDSADCLLVGMRWNIHLVPTSKQSIKSVLHIPDAVCTVLDCLLAGTRWNIHLVPASKQSIKSVLHMPDAVCTVLDCLLEKIVKNKPKNWEDVLYNHTIYISFVITQHIQ